MDLAKAHSLQDSLMSTKVTRLTYIASLRGMHTCIYELVDASKGTLITVQRAMLYAVEFAQMKYSFFINLIAKQKNPWSRYYL